MEAAAAAAPGPCAEPGASTVWEASSWPLWSVNAAFSRVNHKNPLHSPIPRWLRLPAVRKTFNQNLEQSLDLKPLFMVKDKVC